MTGAFNLFGHLTDWAESFSSQSNSREIRAATDLAASGTSGYGHGHHKIEYCPEGIPLEQAIFLALAAFAASFGVLYRAVTMALGKKRRKRSDGEADVAWYEVIQDRVGDILWSGMFVCCTYSTLHFAALSFFFHCMLLSLLSFMTPIH